MEHWTPETITKIQKGYFSAVYFERTREILLREKNLTPVTMQVFQKNDNAVLCGTKEVIELLKRTTGYWKGDSWKSCWKQIATQARKDGDMLSGGEPVMHIRGPYVYFAHLESLYLGILARRTLVATNTRRVVEAARGKPVLFFADRFDHFQNQEGDGYAAHVGGASGVCTPAHASWWDGHPVGTIPHALIAIHNGDALAAAQQFVNHFPEVPLVVLVDYDNDCARTALAVARALKNKLWGVRIDTASDMVDVTLRNKRSRANSGVTTALVRLVRRTLDSEGYQHVKIVVSGGFTAEKIRHFEKDKTPVDVYGVGSVLLKGGNDFTADIVQVNGKPEAKAGRTHRRIV